MKKHKSRTSRSYQSSNKYEPHQGKQEKLRRIKQYEKEI